MSDSSQNKKGRVGAFIDIDGVVLHGGKPFECSKEAIHNLWNNDIPFVFVTNGTYSSEVIIKLLKDTLGLPFNKNHTIVAPSPCLALTEYHNKKTLVCCQEDGYPLISELGFTNYITVSELVKIFPELDYVDHKKRVELLENPPSAEVRKQQDEFEPIEAILLLGEPINWECSLQVLLDVLMTNGNPRSKFKVVPTPHLPIIGCNKDITFKGAAPLPRFGHGAFLACLETLYQRVTKNNLVYQHMMGKPCMVTYEFAANQIQKLVPEGEEVSTFFIIGDNPEVDIHGANEFKNFLERERRISFKIGGKQLYQAPGENVQSRCHVGSILVSTGVYNPQHDVQFYLNEDSTLDLDAEAKEDSGEAVAPVDKFEQKKEFCRQHSFISYFDNKLNVPDIIVDSLKEAVDYIVQLKNND